MDALAMPLEHMFARIDALDFTLLKKKLTHAEQGEGWSPEYAERMETAYKRYLKMMAKYPDEKISPTLDVDKFWHAHILDTQRYSEDCQNIFGYVLHHYPYAGMQGDEEAGLQREAADNMHMLYEREFGEAVPNGATWCWAAKPEAKQASAWCWAAKPAERQKAAWCWAAKPEAKQASAWCWAAKPESKQGSTWCWAAKLGAKQQHAAWCWAAKPPERQAGA